MKGVLFLLVAIAFLCLPGLVYAACVTPIEDYNLTSSKTFCSGTYNLVDDGGDGVIRAAANNVVMTCNGTVFMGDGSSGSVGVKINKPGFTMTGCTFVNFKYGVDSTVDGTDQTIDNSTFQNMADSGFFSYGP